MKSKKVTKNITIIKETDSRDVRAVEQKEIIQKSKPVVEKDTSSRGSKPLFEKENLLWMLGGVATMIIGFMLMSGGRSEDPNVFNAGEVYSTTRITVAPILILAGLVLLIFAIFRERKAH
jgi:hypothetical protein